MLPYCASTAMKIRWRSGEKLAEAGGGSIPSGGRISRRVRRLVKAARLGQLRTDTDLINEVVNRIGYSFVASQMRMKASTATVTSRPSVVASGTSLMPRMTG